MSGSRARRLRREEASRPRNGADPWLVLYDEFVAEAVAAYAGPAAPHNPSAADLAALGPISVTHIGQTIPR